MHSSKKTRNSYCSLSQNLIVPVLTAFRRGGRLGLDDSRLYSACNCQWDVYICETMTIFMYMINVKAFKFGTVTTWIYKAIHSLCVHVYQREIKMACAFDCVILHVRFALENQLKLFQIVSLKYIYQIDVFTEIYVGRISSINTKSSTI